MLASAVSPVGSLVSDRKASSSGGAQLLHGSSCAPVALPALRPAVLCSAFNRPNSASPNGRTTTTSSRNNTTTSSRNNTTSSRITGGGGTGKTVSGRKQTAAQAASVRKRHVWDTNLFHYKRWWLQPQAVVVLGVGAIAAANYVFEPGWSSTLVVGAPVALAWWLIFRLLPSKFEQFAKEYITSHPELEEETSSSSSSSNGKQLQRAQDSRKF